MSRDRNDAWWHNVTDNPDQVYLSALDAALAEAQQVGEDVAEQWIAFAAEQRPCPICGRIVADHNRREWRRCDNTRPDLEIVQ
jgi:ribosomal protein S27AE